MTQKVWNGLDVNGQKVANVQDPTNPQDAVTKAYLEAHPPAAATQRTVAFFMG